MGPLFSHEIMKISKNKFEAWRNHYMKNWILIKSGSGLRFGTIILLVDPECTHFNYSIKLTLTPDENFFHNPEHSVWSNILDNLVQNNQIQISEEQIFDFRSDSWENWSPSYQYRVDFVDVMIFKIHERLKKYPKYCTPNESIDTLAWQWT